jgi:type IV pilus assembly protein PilA
VKPQRKWSVPGSSKIDKFTHSASTSKLAKSEGFTLIELLVVVVIIGILIAIAIPLYLNYQKSANDKSAQSDVRAAIGTIEQCNTDNSSYPSALGTLTGNAYALTGCTGQSAKITKNTTLTYAYTAATLSYMVTGKNSSGSGKTYCYNSVAGGSVVALAGSATTC